MAARMGDEVNRSQEPPPGALQKTLAPKAENQLRQNRPLSQVLLNQRMWLVFMNVIILEIFYLLSANSIWELGFVFSFSHPLACIDYFLNFPTYIIGNFQIFVKTGT